MGYTYEQVIIKCREALLDVKTFYQAKVVNYRGKTSDTDEYYSEVVAKFVLDNLEEFKAKIPIIMRKQPYRSDNRTGVFQEDSNRVEEITAIKIFNYSKTGHKYDFIGEIIDYQTPLKSKRGDAAGKIDLLSYDGRVLRILELKKPDSEETMLRCVLEGYTYMKTVDGEKLLGEWKFPEDTTIKASPFVFRNGAQHQEMMENRKYLKQLMKELDSVPYYITEDNGKYYVTED
jgi:hypothetical protein